MNIPKASLAGRGGRLAFGALLVVLALAAILAVSRGRSDAQLLRGDPDRPPSDAAQLRRATASGEQVFAKNCAACHGVGGQGGGVMPAPNLADQDWLYGEGRASEIEQIVAYGIRSGHPKGWNLADMPSYTHPVARYPVPALTPGQIRDLVAALAQGSGRPADPAAAQRGQLLYGRDAGCFDCHGGDARGDPAIGAPNLLDAIWLYGGSDAEVAASVAQGRRGVMPGFDGRLSAVQMRQVSLYVHSLSNPPAAAKEPR